MSRLATFAAAAAAWSTCAALDNGVALTPPMGFNSYMSGLHGAAGLMEIAEYFVSSGLIHSGYTYVNSDEGWEQRTRDPATGKIVPGADFGSMANYSAKIHSMGLKLGLYGAASGVTCGNMPGQLYYEDVDAETYASWGLDYLKSDNCASYALDSSVRFGAMRDALNRTGRRMVLSIEPFSINPDPEQSVKVANLWRVACDIGRSYSDVLNRADISDKWAPLAGPGGWNDPDMINIREKDTLGQSRTYFGLWAIMKAPLLLSSALPTLPADLIAIVNNTGVIAVNQDALGVQARKLLVDGEPLPRLVGLKPCDSAPDRWYTRAFGPASSQDPRRWTVAAASRPNEYVITNVATGRCLTATAAAGSEDDDDIASHEVTVLPCNGSDHQAWRFDKGLHTVTSVTNVGVGLALGVGNGTLYSAQHGSDALPLAAVSYGEARLALVPPFDQANCTSRDCQNYDNTQMWYYSTTDGLMRQSTYTASINHKNHGAGYTLTKKLPTYQHHCMSHVLSNANEGTAAGTTEVWGGPLAPQGGGSGHDYVIGLLNRGGTAATISAPFASLGFPGVDASSSFAVADLWAGKSLGKSTGSVSATVGANDLTLLRLSLA